MAAGLTPCDGRVAVTGFYAGFHAGGQWRELTSTHDSGLRAAFEHAAAAGPLAAAHSPPPQRVLAFSALTERVIGELTSASLWDGDVLTVDPRRVAISFAASKGRLTLSAKEAYLREAVTSTGDWPALALARRVGSSGPLLSPVAACATGAHTIALGAQLIQDGYADVALAGSLEHGLTDVVLAGYRSLGALSASGVMRPFDRRRDGFVAAEGIGCVVLEAEPRARARGATIYGYVTGWSLRADATGMTTMQTDGDTIARAIEDALRRAGQPNIDYINAHGTATKLNDVVETRGIKQVFDAAVPVSATKPLTGHLLGASGSVEAVLCLLAMRESYVPPTLNLATPDDELDLDYIPNVGRYIPVRSTLSLSYGFGGHCGVLILQR